ncbi:MAG: ribose-phosphate pyrophosphokinase [Sulfurovum sp.]|nr:ribose-phosphate pyrophosphokinase [Sulfurovum sp.]
MGNYMLFSGTANGALSNEVARYLEMPLSAVTIKRFSDGEISVQISESVRGKDVFIVQPTCAPANDNLMELLIMTDALKRSSAKSITAVVPYYGYARQDRKAAPRVPITAKLVANMMETAGITRMVTVDLHASQIQGFFDIPVDNLYGAILFMDYIRAKNFPNPVIASPDVGGVARARYFAKELELDMVIIDKRREKANEAEVMNVIGDVEGKDIILIDDMIDTAGTMMKGAKALRNLGATSVMACCTHPVLSGPAYERIEEGELDELVVANTIPLKKMSPKVKVLSTASMLGEVIRRVQNNESVNSLFVLHS